VTGIEFVVVLAWVLLPPLAIASAALASVGRSSPVRYLTRRRVESWFLLLALSILISLAVVIWSPVTLGRYIGVQDRPFLWAPFSFIAVLLAFGPALWWARRGARR
jgi:hypothetical protein